MLFDSLGRRPGHESRRSRDDRFIHFMRYSFPGDGGAYSYSKRPSNLPTSRSASSSCSSFSASWPSSDPPARRQPGGDRLRRCPSNTDGRRRAVHHRRQCRCVTRPSLPRRRRGTRAGGRLGEPASDSSRRVSPGSVRKLGAHQPAAAPACAGAEYQQASSGEHPVVGSGDFTMSEKTELTGLLGSWSSGMSLLTFVCELLVEIAIRKPSVRASIVFARKVSRGIATSMK